MSLPLTQRQAECLEIIRKGKKGVCPSYDEIMAEMGLRSKSGIHRMVTALEERGFIERIPDRARAIRLVEPKALPTRSVTLSADVYLLAERAARSRGEPLKEYIESAICALAEIDLG